MRQSACLDCHHIIDHIDQDFCPACQSLNMTSNRYQIVLVHAKRIEKDHNSGSDEFREKRFQALKTLAEQADLMTDKRRLRKLLKDHPEYFNGQEDIEQKRQALRDKYKTKINFDEYFPAAKAENWRAVNASN